MLWSAVVGRRPNMTPFAPGLARHEMIDLEDKILGSWLGMAVGDGFLGRRSLAESFA